MIKFNISSASEKLSEERHDIKRGVTRFPLLGTLRDFVNEVHLSREERDELVELQRSLGTKSRRETIQIAREFAIMMDKGRDYDELSY
mmetsp:Transcript_32031/g.57939  ORF Transcript_32031/g.57939 Transcript_32031/m.57939 type:complete len:88 (-) Transcript_32031:66-329(-)